MFLHDNEVIGIFNSVDCGTVYVNTASMLKSWTGLAVGILELWNENDKESSVVFRDYSLPLYFNPD